MNPDKDPEGFERQHLLDYADFNDARVLEIGCGDGRLTWKYAAVSRLIIGLDPDLGQLRLAHADYHPALRGRVHFTSGSAYHIPLPKDTFDIAILSWSL